MRLLKSQSGSKNNKKISTDDKPILRENTPNPFSSETTIGYYLPRSTEKANIYVFNMAGSLLLNKSIQGSGEGSIIINASELKPGLYMYSLVIGNKVISTK